MILKIILTVVFLFAIVLIIDFIETTISWHTSSIDPDNFDMDEININKKVKSRTRDIMIAIMLWTILLFLLL